MEEERAGEPSGIPESGGGERGDARRFGDEDGIELGVLGRDECFIAERRGGG